MPKPIAAGLICFYFHSTQSGADKAQQSDYLLQCLECWQCEPGPAGKDSEADASTFAKLAEFVATHRTFTWAQIIDIVQLAGEAQWMEPATAACSEVFDNFKFAEASLTIHMLPESLCEHRLTALPAHGGPTSKKTKGWQSLNTSCIRTA